MHTNSTDRIPIAVKLLACLILITSPTGSAAAQSDGVKFHGTVVDADGSPVVGARVLLISNRSPDLEKRQTIEGDPTDAQGRFSITQEGDSAWIGAIYKKGFAPAFEDLYRNSGEHSERSPSKIELAVAKPVSFSVTDSDNSPAKIKSARLLWVYFDSDYIPFGNSVSQPLPILVKQNTISLDWLPESGWISIEIETDVKRSVSFGIREPSFEVTLPKTTKLSGTIKMKDGSNIPEEVLENLKLSFSLSQKVEVVESTDVASDPPPFPPPRVEQNTAASLDANGAFEIDCIPGTGNATVFNGNQHILSQQFTTDLKNSNHVTITYTPPRTASGIGLIQMENRLLVSTFPVALATWPESTSLRLTNRLPTTRSIRFLKVT